MGGITQLILVAIITAFATWSVVAGLKSGIPRLSQLNILAALLLLIVSLHLGMTRWVERHPQATERPIEPSPPRPPRRAARPRRGAPRK